MAANVDLAKLAALREIERDCIELQGEAYRKFIDLLGSYGSPEYAYAKGYFYGVNDSLLRIQERIRRCFGPDAFELERDNVRRRWAARKEAEKNVGST